ncbi:hypothetical protein THRCLA_08429 [Thraustotheca clavata]|uniref:HSF-type DNA-binding domain-containing protein n=1 Tax=Thraustotheca clavata TaxID=74557 RepID=A0A1V9Z6E6_9STRA|nr:hypothetical protein THRCLA_08429 [Thraustotheca clavata]
MSRRKSIAPFIQTLLEMLQSNSPGLCWSTDGRSFDIIDTNVFAKAVLPQFFRHSKFSSFQRQLNYFGFRKQARRQSNVCTYAHPHYSLRVPSEVLQIKRKMSSTSTFKNKPCRDPRPILAYTEASMAYSQLPPKANVQVEFSPLPFHDYDPIDRLLDEDMMWWLLNND